MRSRYHARETERAYFVTSTIVDWLPVFVSSACCDILVGSLEFSRREKGLKVYAWVIMENHFHTVVPSDQLPRVMADLKKFTAGKLLAQLKEERREWLRELLASGKAEHKTGVNTRCGRRGIIRRQFIKIRRCCRRLSTFM